MTSSNVSNLLVQMGQEISAVNDSLKSHAAEVDKNLFEKALQSLSSSVETKNSVSRVNNSTDIQNSTKTVEVKTESLASKSKIKTEEKEAITSDDVENVKDEVNDFAKKVKDVIEEELDVSEEEINKAMEVLGLTAIDLAQPENLVKLVNQLTDNVDSISLVLSDEFKNILDSVIDFTDQLLESTGISLDDISSILNADFSEELPKMEIHLEDFTVENPEGNENLPEIVDENAQSEEPIITVTVEKEVDTTEEDAEPNTEDVVTVEQTTDKTSPSENAADSFSSSEGEKNNSQGSLGESKIQSNFENVIVDNSKVTFDYSSYDETITLSTGETVSTQEMIDQIVEQARILNTSESSTMEMTLNPEGLGKIYMEVTQKGDEITAKIYTENEIVKEALENQMSTLRAELNQTSSKVTSIEVSVGTHEFEKNLEENEHSNEQNNEQANQNQKRRTRIDLNDLDSLSGLMTEEEQLVAQIMRENGNTLDFQA